jgi:hypothetical protein
MNKYYFTSVYKLIKTIGLYKSLSKGLKKCVIIRYFKIRSNLKDNMLFQMNYKQVIFVVQLV